MSDILQKRIGRVLACGLLENVYNQKKTQGFKIELIFTSNTVLASCNDCDFNISSKFILDKDIITESFYDEIWNKIFAEKKNRAFFDSLYDNEVSW